MDNLQTEKLVIFNWNGVLEDHSLKGENSYRQACIDLLRHFNSNLFHAFSEATIYQYWVMHMEAYAYLDGSMPNLFQWFHAVCKDFDLYCDYIQFTTKMTEIFDHIDFYPQVLELAKSLKNHCRTAVWANISSLDFPRFERQCKDCGFDHEWLSFQIGNIIPSKEGYQKVEEACGLEKGQIMLIDSTQFNLDVAYTRDWRTCLFEGHNYEKLKSDCEDFLGVEL